MNNNYYLKSAAETAKLTLFTPGFDTIPLGYPIIVAMPSSIVVNKSFVVQKHETNVKTKSCHKQSAKDKQNKKGIACFSNDGELLYYY